MSFAAIAPFILPAISTAATVAGTLLQTSANRRAQRQEGDVINVMRRAEEDAANRGRQIEIARNRAAFAPDVFPQALQRQTESIGRDILRDIAPAVAAVQEGGRISGNVSQSFDEAQKESAKRLASGSEKLARDVGALLAFPGVQREQFPSQIGFGIDQALTAEELNSILRGQQSKIGEIRTAPSGTATAGELLKLVGGIGLSGGFNNLFDGVGGPQTRINPLLNTGGGFTANLPSGSLFSRG